MDAALADLRAWSAAAASTSRTQRLRPCVAATISPAVGWLREVVDGDRRQVVVDLRPRLAPVDRGPDAELGAEVEQVGVLDVLAQAARSSPAAGSPRSDFQVWPKSSVTKTSGSSSSERWPSKAT